MKIIAEFLYAIAPGASREIVDAIVSAQSVLTSNGITEPDDLAFFFGFAACETGGFTKLAENLYYTSPARLRAVWPKRFLNDAAALAYVRAPEKLANFVYGGRFGNRPNTNDGWDYRGSGVGQITFRDNFNVVERETKIRCVAAPDLLRRMPEALLAAAIFWRIHNLARFVENNDYVGLTKAWQGGDGGLKDRMTFTKRALDWWARYGNVATERPQWDQRDDWLRKGDKGAPVLALQKKLQIAGYYQGGNLDGDFGDGTDDAVRHFQKSNGLVEDGVFGNATAKALNAKVNAALAATKADDPVASSPPAVDKSTGIGAILAAIIGAILALFGKGPKNGKV